MQQIKQRFTFQSILFLLFLCIGSAELHAQLILPTGGNHPELHWKEFRTEHFIIIYHDGLDSVALKAAPMAEEAYTVVTTNLKTPLVSKVKIYFSDYDEVKNAFAFDDDYIFIWMRGILDDLPYGLRSSGTSKWLRSVITHEFTHIVIAHATKDFSSLFSPASNVPRWFNEGLARYMEPDGWTSDLDALLRVATVSGHLDLGDDDDYLSGSLMYEGGQSFIRYIAMKYGDSALVKIIKHPKEFLSYDFDKAVKDVTKKDLGDLEEDWHKTLNVYFNTTYGQKEEADEFAHKIPVDLAVTLAARLEPGGKRIALIGGRSKKSPPRLYLLANDTSGKAILLSDEAGIEPVFSWYPGEDALCISKYRIGSSGTIVHDLYKIELETNDLTRLTDDGRYEQPDVALQGNKIVAVRTEQNHSDLFILNPNGSNPVQLTQYNDPNTQVYAPRWSPDGKTITYSVFRSNGMRDIAVIDVASKRITLITNDSANDRSSVFSPDGKEVVFLSHRNGIPNCYRAHADAGAALIQMTDVAGEMFPWDWSGAKDSILATSFDARNSVGLYWVPAGREVTSAPIPELKPKYIDWRTMHFPLLTRPADSIPQVSITDAGAYNSLVHIRPIFVLPVLHSDKGKTGEPGTRFGLIGTAFDPMEKHIFNAFLDYGDESNEFGGLLSYTNRQLYQNINVTALHMYGFVKTLEGRAVYEREEGGSLLVSQVFSAPNSLTTSHVVSISASLRKLEPANLEEFDSLPFSQTPIGYKGIELSLSYLFLSRDLIFGVEFTHADKNMSSDLTYTRAKLNFVYKYPFDEDRNVMLAFRGAGVAQFGAQIPQEYVGFTTDEVFERGFNPRHLEYNYRLRGIRRPYYGDRLALGSAELVMGSGLSLVAFYDIGSVWYDKTPSNYPTVETTTLAKTGWLQSAGTELRLGNEGIATISGGVGWELRRHPPPDWYFRVTTYF
ncbi:MAG: BamA/TamA family outer membrane protein [Bacteroidota bacterium]|nr:BamA/TamA family outer membrane protein [Bacteroidota bacterium]MDP4230666.1 BamA/TamA family outer membrane protein [Bacteroidota bacterium]MDP4235356.1 BamA/TamA family outer membrane protein [Bacteroidota bacterium]